MDYYTKSSWEDTYKLISDLDDNQINNDMLDKIMEAFQNDLFSTILFRDKYLTIYETPKNYDNILTILDDLSEGFDGDFSSILDNALDYQYIKTIHGNLTFIHLNQLDHYQQKLI